MPLFQEVDNHLKEAMRSQDKERLRALRNIKSFLKNKAIEAKRDLEDQEVVQYLSTLAKQRRESIEAYEKAGREDLVAQETSELGVIQTYLPKPLTEAELDDLIAGAIGETGAAGPQDMGKVMKALKEKVTGRADGKIVSARVKDKLSG